MTPAIEALEGELATGMVRHGGHTVPRWCAATANAVRDPAGNRKLDKSKTTGRIDGLVAMGTAQAQAPKSEPKYQMFVLG